MNAILKIIMIGVWILCLGVGGMSQAAPPEKDGVKRKLIRNVSTLISMDPSVGKGPLGILHDVDILFDDRVIAIGKNISANGAQIIEGPGKVVMPGLVNVHDTFGSR